MSRWEPGAAERLHTAAVELFLEQGFAATTVPQITARAGLTTRSFFRYFADKREVLFTGEDELPDVVAQVFAEADADLSAMQVIRQGLSGVIAPRLQQFRGELIARRRIVASDEGLQERQLRKSAILHRAAAAAFENRGFRRSDADLLGRLAIAVFDSALEQWLDDGSRRLEEIAEDLLDALPTLMASPSRQEPTHSGSPERSLPGGPRT